MLTLVLALIVHFIADFLLQSREMGKNKSNSYKYLAQHIAIIFICFLPFGFTFALINALVHAVIDKFIWNGYKWFTMKRMGMKHEYSMKIMDYKYWEDSWFYATIGLDQFLHTLTLMALAFWIL